MMHSAELSKLFAAERAVRAPAGALDRGLSRLLAEVAAQVAPLPVAAGSLKLTWVAVSKWILAGFALGIAGSGAAARVWAPPAAATAPLSVVTQATPSALNAAVESSPALAIPEPTSSVETAAVSPPAPHLPAALPSSSEPGRFDAELRLITLAKGELDRGRPHLAKVWLAEHAERFPTGVFSSDREALSVLARCAEKRDLGLAQTFVVRHPSSPMAARLLHACESTAAASSTNESPRLGEPTHE
jgi:hypothetical protein